MDRLATHLALHGAGLLLFSLVAGFFTYRAIVHDGRVAAWHLAHAGGSGRALALLALAATIHRVQLPLWQLTVIVWLMIFFAWSTMLAMMVAAATGERGLGLRGSVVNRFIFVLYVAGGVAVFPAAIALIHGFWNTLQSL